MEKAVGEDKGREITNYQHKQKGFELGKNNQMCCHLNRVEWWNTETKLKQCLPYLFCQAQLHLFIAYSSAPLTPNTAAGRGMGVVVSP